VFAAHEEALGGTIQQLKQLREKKGLSLQEVADRMGTDRANVHRLENAPGNPTVATLARYAEAMGKRIVISVANQ
jgi:transcriptional regulator with XRE-family HTH domain